jgi:signal transduction histidine kinase
MQARDEERKRISRELHDELGQRLAALKLELSAIDPCTHPSLSAERWQTLVDMVDDTVAATRQLAVELRPAKLGDLGLKASIGWLCHELERRSSLRVELQVDLVSEQMPQAVLTTLYRTVQEALTNIVRHAKARRAWVTLGCTDAWVTLRVEDNGHGMPDRVGPSERTSLGLMGVRERVQMLGGQLNWGARAGGGFSLVVRLPLCGEADTCAMSRLALHPGVLA